MVTRLTYVVAYIADVKAFTVQLMQLQSNNAQTSQWHVYCILSVMAGLSLTKIVPSIANMAILHDGCGIGNSSDIVV